MRRLNLLLDHLYKKGYTTFVNNFAATGVPRVCTGYIHRRQGAIANTTFPQLRKYSTFLLHVQYRVQVCAAQASYPSHPSPTHARRSLTPSHLDPGWLALRI